VRRAKDSGKDRGDVEDGETLEELVKEYDGVRVVRLKTPGRHFDGTENVKRQPEVGDVGTIVHVNAPGENYIVESVDSGGYTVWLADFSFNELEIVLESNSMMGRIKPVTYDLKKVADDAKVEFGGLTTEQLNWKPAEKSWSVAQCFDHLITTHGLYFPVFERLAMGDVKQSVWENYSPLSGFFGRFLIKSLRPENVKKMKTTMKAQPSASEIDGGIIERFGEHQNQMIEHLQRLPTDIDPVKTIITSPLLSFVTYSLDDCFTILVVHVQRHFGQAKRVTETDGFPA
jgi:hypothetical protein